MAAEVTLGQLIERMIPTDRLIVQDESGKELYKGYVGCTQYEHLDTSRHVKKTGLKTNIFLREQRQAGTKFDRVPGGAVDADHLSEFKFSDLVMQIFTKVIVEG